jgi:hypothetical protein
MVPPRISRYILNFIFHILPVIVTNREFQVNYVLPNPLAEDITLPGYFLANGAIGGNRTKALPALVPKSQSDIPMSQRAESQGQPLAR